MASGTKFKILVSDPLGKAGMAELRKDKALLIDEKTGLDPDALKKIIGAYDAIVIRSGTRLTREIIDAAKNLKVIGRAGVGVDNVDLDAATKRGIIVMNTPEGNTISTAEHTFSMLMALARNIPQAYDSVRGGEWKRQQFLGTELNGKVLGVVGFGRIGREVAKRAAAFGMKVVTFDPFISKESVSEYPVEFMELKNLLKIADFITVHTPLTPETRHVINAESFQICKKGVKIINCARGGIIDEKALLEALQSGKAAGAALDVFEQEPPKDNPLLKLPQVISTPHLGAATQEAQENVAVEVARQVTDALHERGFKNAVNLPNVDPEVYRVLKPWIELAEKMGKLQVQLFEGRLEKVTVRYCGLPTRFNTKPLTNAVVKGLLTPVCGETVNFVNAFAMAKERGLAINESNVTQSSDYTNFIEIETRQVTEKSGKARLAPPEAGAARQEKESHHVMGTVYEGQFSRIVQVDQFKRTDVNPSGHVIFIRNEDKPGVVGTLGTILGKNGINIADMSLERNVCGKKVMALTVINTDSDVPAKVLAQIKKLGKLIIDVKIVSL